MFPIAAGAVAPSRPGGRPAFWAATGRSGGTSAAPYSSLNLAGYVADDPEHVAENRRRVARALGLDPDRLALMDSVHGAEVAFVGAPGVVPGVDALVTQEPDLAVMALGADCVPLALVGDDDRTVAAVHCGWRGLVVDVVGAAVGAMADHGSGIAHAVIGPAVCGTCYPVPPDRARLVAESGRGAVADAALVTCPDGQPGIDVRRGVVARLLGLGLPAESLTVVGGCTVEDPQLFSYRRDGRTGRQGIAVCRSGPGRIEAS